MTILEALADPLLLGATFDGPDWDPWRAYFAAAYALPLEQAPAGAFDLFRRCTGRSTWPTRTARRRVAICGRRGRKTAAAMFDGVYQATLAGRERRLAPGEVGVVGLMAPNKLQAAIGKRYASATLAASPLLAPMVTRETQDTIELSNGLQLEVTALNYRTIRGRTIVAFVADEMAFWESDESANPDVEVLRAVQPALDETGGPLMLVTSPYSKRGEVYRLFRQHWGQDDSDTLVWVADSKTMNPTLSQDMIDQAYLEDPESAEAEWGGQFRRDLSGFVTVEAIDAVTVPGRLELPRLPGTKYVAFTDPSGGSGRDAMTLAVCHLERDVAVLDAVRVVDPPFAPDVVVDGFAQLLHAYGCREATGDRFAGEWCRQVFERAGIAYRLSARTKADIYRDVLPALNSGRVELLDLPRLRTELLRLERRSGRTGRDVIDHPPNGRDDVANAVCGALVTVAHSRLAFGMMRLEWL